MAEKEKINPVTLDIVKDSLIAVSNEIFYAFAQTSMSPIIYETLDYASGIADAEGRLLTQGNGVTGFIGMISPMICAVVEKHGKENLHPGDVYIINDPFMGGGTHMSDVGMVMPIFYHDELIAFAGNKAHWSDIGGMAPGSFTTDATNLYQEGMCFSGTKLVDRGELVEPVWDLMRSNMRYPQISQGDMWGQISSLRTGEKRICELCDKYGADVVKGSMEHLVSQGEKVARRRLAEMPKGTWEMDEYMDNDGHGNYSELEQKNIDSGMGLERLASVVQDVDSIFDVDTVQALRDKVCEAANVTYKKDADQDVSIRLITDHIRSATFMISDGILPSNSGRGYVLRRLLRRACRHGRLLGIKGAFLVELAETVIEGSKDGYPELEEKKDFIFKVITKEEEQFNKTIDQGLSILAGMEAEMAKKGETVLAGEEAFRLYDTYGFPVDLTKEILEEKGMQIDEEGFKKAMEAQRETAKGTFGEHNYMGPDLTIYESIDPSVTTEFVGYDHTEYESPVTVLTTEDEIVDALSDGDRGTIFVEKTPFYATSGGQQADTGVIRTADFEFQVEDVKKLLVGKIAHV